MGSKSFFNFFTNRVKSFFSTEALSSLFLLSSAGLALFLANSEWKELYETLIHYPVAFNIGAYSIKSNLHYVINEGLMTLFFFVVGMEIKREFMEGELSSAKKASLPLIAAIGGSLVPALIFYFFNQNLPTEKGWGIPMATDIAFAVGVMSLLSHRVPFALKIFLLSVAIIDDIIAVLVIALFYSGQISGPFLAFIFVISVAIILYFKLNLNNSLLFFALSLALWLAVHRSGVHATLSGVILGCLIPHRNRWTQKQALDAVKRAFGKKEEASLGEVTNLKGVLQGTKSSLQRLVSRFHPYVSYLIMPLFAFANAGIPLKGIDLKEWIQNPVSYGILLGLCLGKPLGIFAFSWLACATKLSERPQHVLWPHILSVGFLAGIGFTMSLFIMNLCFDMSSSFYSFAKLSIIAASSFSALVGLILLFFGKKVPLSQRRK